MRKIVHIGSQSIDANANSSSDITNVITALLGSVSNLDTIAIGTYLDYTSQITLWANAIHAAGKKFVLRSAGFNDWQGRNGVTQYTSSDFADHSNAQFLTWINANYSLFLPGDEFEPVPDEPENNSMWNSTYGTIGSGTGQTAYNSFITTAKSQIDSAFATNGVTGVLTGFIHTSPSAQKDVITDATMTALSANCTDDYPEISSTTPTQMQQAMISELNNYVIPAHASLNKQRHITFGPNVWATIADNDQEIAMFWEYTAIMEMVSLEGITIWQFGATDNGPASRLFNWSGSAWTPRPAAAMANRLFSSHYAPSNYNRFGPVGNGMSRSEGWT